MNMDNALQSGLSTGTGAIVYPLMVKQETTLPALAYRRISDRLIDNAHGYGNRGHLHEVRLQITHVASSYAGLRTLVDATRTALDGCGFSAVTETAIQIEDRETDGVYTSIKDYFIQYKDV